MRQVRVLVVFAAFIAGCAGGTDREAGLDSTAASFTRVEADTTATCFVAGQSVLARAGNPAALAGWITLANFRVSDSAGATLVDSDGFSLDAVWRRLHDSIVVTGFNDFVRIEMRLHATDTLARGILNAHSDAALERDSVGQLVEFRRSSDITLKKDRCDRMPLPAGRAAIDVLPHGTPRPGVVFDPAAIRRGTTVGVLNADSVNVRQALDSTLVGSAWFRGEIVLTGWTLRNPDPDLYRVMTCFEADSSSAARLPRWSGDERRAWFCFSNRAEAARALGPPSEGVPATIAIDQFTIHRGMSDEVNSARFVRLVRRGIRD